MTSTALSLGAGLVSGLGGGLLSGLFGVGGGIVLVPILSLVLGMDQHRAQGMSLAAMLLPNGLPAVLHIRGRGVPIRWALAGALFLGFLPASWAGARLANALPETPLRLIFVGFLVFLSLRTLLGGKAGPLPGAGPARTPLLPGLLIGALGGLTSGLLGIGGAVLMIPLMVQGLGLPQLEAQLASLVFMLPPVGLPAVLEYARHQPILWPVVAGMAPGFMIGAYAGARLATRLPASRLQKAFAWVIIFLGLVLLLQKRH